MHTYIHTFIHTYIHTNNFAVFCLVTYTIIYIIIEHHYYRTPLRAIYEIVIDEDTTDAIHFLKNQELFYSCNHQQPQ